jgi:ParB family chromosome partitioning protein
MAKSIGNLALSGFSDIFNAGTHCNDGENIIQIQLTELFPPDFHPFQVNDDAAMTRLVKSVKEHGVREPGVARPRAEGGYELLCGNRRKRACELAGISSLPVIVREMSDDDAVIVMIDSNLEQRERILPSERAWAYKLKMEALNHNGVKGERHSCDIMAEQMSESKNQLFRWIRLTELVADLIDRVDAKQLAFNPAVELSYLTQIEQGAVVAAMVKYDVKPSLSQAVKLKKMKQGGTLTVDVIDSTLAEEKSNAGTPRTPAPQDKEAATIVKFRSFFPDGYSPKQIETVIIGLLRDWKTAQSKETNV